LTCQLPEAGPTPAPLNRPLLLGGQKNGGAIGAQPHERKNRAVGILADSLARKSAGLYEGTPVYPEADPSAPRNLSMHWSDDIAVRRVTGEPLFLQIEECRREACSIF